ncbi:hypothetical protein OVA06_01720 [Pseudarthrobacter sp. SL88]|uniref:hypothetical protein n=1 Tax=Pseudarthrobacter sp. SL88 TaxID=2994666 RepID=UPI0022724981|nr:hypothetical protein [Pseudarthrobacter sp. SL88]MCY1673442.1 hypothetical protein [Pseudarthrobacter sp. SL88]
MTDEMQRDERQTRVTEALENRSPKLAGMYRTALDLLAAQVPAGCETARISTICHCMRELMLNLPAVMSTDPIAIPRPTPSSGSLLKQLPGLLAAHPDADLGLDRDLVPVPREVAHGLAELIKTATQEEGRNRANTAALVTGETDARHPAIGQWTDSYNFFLNWTHLDRNHEQEKSLPADETLRGNIRVVEDLIQVRSALFFQNLNALRDMLADINDFGDEEDE